MTVLAHGFTEAARAAIEKNGGTCVVLPKTAPADKRLTAENYDGARAGSPEESELTEENVEIVDEVEGADDVEEPDHDRGGGHRVPADGAAPLEGRWPHFAADDVS